MVKQVHVATTARTEEEAVDVLIERVALFYNMPPEHVGLLVTGAEQEACEDDYLCLTETAVAGMKFRVEGYGYVKTGTETRRWRM